MSDLIRVDKNITNQLDLYFSFIGWGSRRQVLAVNGKLQTKVNITVIFLTNEEHVVSVVYFVHLTCPQRLKSENRLSKGRNAKTI